jgi:DNA-binding transcriptional ArsR family regulator
MKNDTEFENCARRLKALADPERLRIIGCLFAGPTNVSDLSAALSHEIVKVSHHLGVLRNAGLVEAKKQGRFVVYALHSDVIHVAKRNETSKFIDLGCCRLELETRVANTPIGSSTK